MNRGNPGELGFDTFFIPRQTGLAVEVWAGRKSGGRKREPQVYAVRHEAEEVTGGFAVSISDTPEVLYGTVSIVPEELERVFQWVTANKDVLLEYWNGAISSVDFFYGLKRHGGDFRDGLPGTEVFQYLQGVSYEREYC